MKKFRVTFFNADYPSNTSQESYFYIEAKDFKQALTKLADEDDPGYLEDKDLVSVRVEEVK
jgi:hypothetical protein